MDDAATDAPAAAASDPREIDADLLSLLVCPVSKKALTFDKAEQELVCVDSRLAYPIRDGIPIMLPDEARELSDAEVVRWRQTR